MSTLGKLQQLKVGDIHATRLTKPTNVLDLGVPLLIIKQFLFGFVNFRH